jgi:predicted MFS family arabinose efflux permease
METKQLQKMVFVLGFMAFWVNGDNYAAAPLLIDIAKDLQIEISQAAFSVTAYMLAFGWLTILYGPLGDRYGRSQIIKIAAFGTAIFSVLGAFAHNLLFLIIIRAINGTFAAGILPVSVALVGEKTEMSQRQNMIGRVMGMMFLGGVVATAIGGLLTYFGSWRFVYGVYGIAELMLALAMLRVLEKSPGNIAKLNFSKAYKEALSNRALVGTVSLMFLVGFSVFGSFTYSGKFIQNITGYNILFVGLILSLFGIGTVVGGRKAGAIRNWLGHKFFLIVGILGALCLGCLAWIHSITVIAIVLFVFGVSFILLQSTLVTTAQEALPKLRGTAMSLASFNMVVGGAVGTVVNGLIINYYGIDKIYLASSILFIIVGLLAYARTRRVKKIQEETLVESSG